MALPKSHSQSVLPNPRLLVLETIEQFEDRFLLTVRVQQVPLCPECGRASESRHSHYVRRLQDLPWQGLSVQIHLRVRRFRCRNPDCQRRVFTERVEGVPPYLRQTSRLAEIVRLVGYVAGGLPGARLLARLAILTSDDTVLRRVKVPSSATLSSNPPDVLGVDDWAWRKGHTYGTILVDLEQHCVVDLLPCRSAESFEAWLKEQRFSRSNASRRPVSSPFEPLGSRRARPGRTQPPTAASVSRTTAPRFAGSELTSDKNDPARFSQTAAAPAPPRPLRTSYRAVPSGMFAEEDQ